MSVEAPRKMLHSKRSFGKYPKGVDSPAYDASEEDNDPLTDDAASAMSIPVIVPRQQPPPAAGPSVAPSSGLPSRVHTRPSFTSRPKHHLAASFLSDSDGVDSPTYDGDVESSATAGADTQSFKVSHHPTSSTSTLGTPVTPNFPALSTQSTPENGNDDHDAGYVGDENLRGVVPVPARSLSTSSAGWPAEPSSATLALTGVNTRELTIEEIQAFVRRAIEGEPWRPYKINKPPTDRPVRIYADGVYDLFHFGHALQLRQAKLSFPSVYLLVGVNTDEDVKAHKAQGIMPHAERVESVRHCKWVDEVVLEAPWVINEAFLQKYHIDYVAHDESPYASAGSDDVYGYVKSQGKFLPTRRTAGISTSDLLERIVSGYRKRDFDDKLTKMGHAELRAEGSDYDSLNSSRQASRRVSRSASVQDNLGKIDQSQ